MATVLYAEKTKEELIDILLDQDKRLAQQDKRIKELEEALERAKQAKKKDIPKFVKLTTPRRRRKRLGQKRGHIGTSRPLPDRIDEIIEMPLTHCPRCKHHLDKPMESFDHIQEDIIPARVKVTCFKKYRYWCPVCKEAVTSLPHRQEIPHGRLGPHVLIHTAILKYYHHLPYNNIKKLFVQMAGITVSEGALAQSLQRLSQWLKVEAKTILQAIRQSPHIHIDETGWYLRGKSHWLWAFVNERLAYYTIEPSRARKVLKRVLGNIFSGVITADFYSAYLKLPYRMQKCLVHLFRELHRCRQRDGPGVYRLYYKKIKRVLDDAIRLSEKREVYSTALYARRCKRIKERLFALACYPYRNKNLKRIAKRFLKYWLDIVYFLEHPGIPWNNNHAERMIRPHVINRNRSFGNKSPKGAQAHSILTSLLHTLRLQERDPFQSLEDAFLSHVHGDTQPVLFG